MQSIVVRVLLVLVLCSVSSACTSGSVPDAASTGGDTSGDPESEDQKILNALGQALAQNVSGAGLSAEELAFVQRGLSDAALGNDALVELTEYGPKIQTFMQGRAETAAEGELAHATAFMEEQAGVEGAERTESGMVIQEMLAGTGATPTTEDTVRVHYHGTLRDGTVFDSSVDRDVPATFPVSQVIPCWTEGLQLMKVGGKSRLACPSDLAYGAQGSPGIPGNAALLFEVELLEIVQAE